MLLASPSQKWPTRLLFDLFLCFQTHITIFSTNKCEKMSIQFTVLGFELTTFGILVSSRPWNLVCRSLLTFFHHLLHSFWNIFFYIFSLTQFAKNICKKGVNFGLPFCQFWPRLVLNGNCWFEPMQIIFFTLPNLSWRQFCSIVNSLVWTLFAVQVFF